MTEQFWSNTIIKQQEQEHYMNLQTDPVDNLLTTHPIETGWEVSNQLYPSGQFRCIDDPDRQFGDSSVLIQTWTQSDSLDPLLTLILSMTLLNVSSSLGIVTTSIRSTADVSAGCPRGGVVWISKTWWGTEFSFSDGFHSPSVPIILR